MKIKQIVSSELKKPLFHSQLKGHHARYRRINYAKIYMQNRLNPDNQMWNPNNLFIHFFPHNLSSIIITLHPEWYNLKKAGERSFHPSNMKLNFPHQWIKAFVSLRTSFSIMIRKIPSATYLLSIINALLVMGHILYRKKIKPLCSIPPKKKWILRSVTSWRIIKKDLKEKKELKQITMGPKLKEKKVRIKM